MKTEKINNLLEELASAPDEFGNILKKFPNDKIDWKPESWAEVPSEEFSLIGHICHLRDIEIDGYQLRFQRVVNEEKPFLPSVDGYELEKSRQYASQNIDVALDEFRIARRQTIEMLKSFRDTDFQRTATFEGYGEVNLIGLIYFLKSHDLQHLSGLSWLLGKLELLS